MKTAPPECFRFALGALMLLGVPGGAKSFENDVERFLKTFCHDCHADGNSEGGFELDRVAQDLNQPPTFATWERLFDRVADAEMPPPDASQPSDAERQQFVEQLGKPLALPMRRQKERRCDV